MTPADDLLTFDIRHRLSRIDLEVRLTVGRETLALVGPSGAGKTSVLRAIAGLLKPDHARIVYDGRPLVDTERRIDLPPDRRRVGMMFQDGALFPHMTVERNVAYGLRPRTRSRRARRARVAELLARFGIEGLARTRPGKASGGERQRAALARAVATTPDILLLDEPLSALDSITKAHVSRELAEWLTELGLPTILVSHDYDDVVGLADRIAVIDAGRVVQSGTAADLIRTPASTFVAAFVGTNFFPGSARRSGGVTEIVMPGGAAFTSTALASGPAAVIVDPWSVRLSAGEATPAGPNVLHGRVAQIARTGSTVRVTVSSDPPIVAELPAQQADLLGLDHGTPVAATWQVDATRLVPLAADTAATAGRGPDPSLPQRG